MTRPNRYLASRSGALLLGLAACRPDGSATERPTTSAGPSAPTALASTTRTGSAPSSSASAGAPPTQSGTAAEDASITLDESAMDRLVSRDLLVGGYTFNWRRTWILYRSETRARLDVLCQMGTDYARLTGEEHAPDAWKPPVLMRYVGTREGTFNYRVSLVAGTPGKYECSWMPEAIVLSCRQESIPVRPAGAKLITDNGSEQRFHWEPGATGSVTGLRCEGTTNARFKWPLVFVAPRRDAPGIEWAFQHDDAALQQGAYRWMPAPR